MIDDNYKISFEEKKNKKKLRRERSLIDRLSQRSSRHRAILTLTLIFSFECYFITSLKLKKKLNLKILIIKIIKLKLNISIVINLFVKI